ncbi:hypothetical protein [Streptomyces sp. NRRL S-495]|uniref:hypothetical protein n=1 Tax=Streptomyces sp. NRRL S-495 TaxID=1609133 RepID=UPI0005F984E3|nr:hypothetical protein [Streptomyces sp. NRRL S-495]KJY32142.1 hypothetical protein VR45_23275 [Streptomyces sp. NRRL S-495]
MATVSIVVLMAALSVLLLRLGAIKVWQLLVGVVLGFVLASTGAGPWIQDLIDNFFAWVGHFKF